MTESLSALTGENLRVGVFAGALLLMALLEWLIPRRSSNPKRAARWTANVILAIVNNILVRLLVAGFLLALAADLRAIPFGLLSTTEGLVWFQILLTVLSFDLGLYVFHRLNHHFDLLWRYHRVHHSDVTVDATTGIRFHPAEVFGGLAVKAAIVLVLCPSALAIIAAELFLNIGSVLNHANVALHPRLDFLLRLVFVTPDMHVVHHSIKGEEARSNYGPTLSFWDRLFGTYLPRIASGPDAVLGLPGQRDPNRLHVLELLVTPLRSLDPPQEAPPPGSETESTKSDS